VDLCKQSTRHPVHGTKCCRAASAPSGGHLVGSLASARPTKGIPIRPPHQHRSRPPTERRFSRLYSAKAAESTIRPGLASRPLKDCLSGQNRAIGTRGPKDADSPQIGEDGLPTGRSLQRLRSQRSQSDPPPSEQFRLTTRSPPGTTRIGGGLESDAVSRREEAALLPSRDMNPIASSTSSADRPNRREEPMRTAASKEVICRAPTLLTRRGARVAGTLTLGGAGRSPLGALRGGAFPRRDQQGRRHVS
jgi:hypothetical protein